MTNQCIIVKRGRYFRVLEREGKNWKMHSNYFNNRNSALNYIYKFRGKK